MPETAIHEHLPSVRAWWRARRVVERWCAEPAYLPASPVAGTHPQLEDRLLQGWSIWKGTEIHQHALSDGTDEVVIQRWIANRESYVGNVFTVIPTRQGLVLSNREFQFLFKSFWGTELTMVRQARQGIPSGLTLQCVCEREIDA